MGTCPMNSFHWEAAWSRPRAPGPPAGAPGSGAAPVAGGTSTSADVERQALFNGSAGITTNSAAMSVEMAGKARGAA